VLMIRAMVWSTMTERQNGPPVISAASASASRRETEKTRSEPEADSVNASNMSNHAADANTVARRRWTIRVLN
jgi:hypothetical protein